MALAAIGGLAAVQTDSAAAGEATTAQVARRVTVPAAELQDANASASAGRPPAIVPPAPTEAHPEVPAQEDHPEAMPDAGGPTEQSSRRPPRANIPALTRIVPPSAGCAQALAAVEGAGLDLPDHTAFRCPGSAQTYPGDRQHSGVACWDHSIFCPGQSFIAVNPELIRPMESAMQYVVAHEICHIHAYRETSLPGTEEAADDCATAAGFPRP